jgi:predicted permease
MALYAQGITALIAVLAAWAWMKSAFLQLGRKPANKNWLDDNLNRISTNPAVWNAIAAGLAALAAVAQAIAYIVEAQPHR